MSGFTKLFSTIVHSTIWRADMPTKVVWVTMLALADRNGHVLASVPGLADASRVTLDDCVAALKVLSEPDPWSRTKAFDGRRIEEIDGGWRLLNYQKYREYRDADERRIQVREAVARHRSKHADPPTDDVIPVINVINVSHGKPKQKQKQRQKQNEDQEISSESALAASEPVALMFPVVGAHGSEWGLTHRQIAEWAELFPNLDVPATMRAALAWARANPSKRKTASGMPRFLVSWLTRETDKVRPAQPQSFNRGDKGSRALDAGNQAIAILGRTT